MSIHHKTSSSSQSSSTEENKVFVSSHFKMCKAKLHKRKFILKQNKAELGLYKQKMLRLVKKKSNQSLEQAQKRLDDLDQQFKQDSDVENIQCLIQQFQSRIRLSSQLKGVDFQQLLSECKRITAMIEAQTYMDLTFVAKAADRIQEICLDAIVRNSKQKYGYRIQQQEIEEV